LKSSIEEGEIRSAWKSFINNDQISEINKSQHKICSQPKIDNKIENSLK
jgi:hypothetical protein